MEKGSRGCLFSFLARIAAVPGSLEGQTVYEVGPGPGGLTHALLDAVTRDSAQDASRHDMGGDIVPDFVSRGDAGVYDFRDNDVPGSTERDRNYWRDVGTLDSYYAAHMDLISVLPVFNLYNYDWPIHAWAGAIPPLPVSACW